MGENNTILHLESSSFSTKLEETCSILYIIIFLIINQNQSIKSVDIMKNNDINRKKNIHYKHVD